MSPWVIATWQTVHGELIAECTDLPIIFLIWHDEQSLSTDPGCSTANSRGALSNTVHSRRELTLASIRFLPVIGVGSL